MGTSVETNRRLAKTQSGEVIADQQAVYQDEILPPANELERYESMYPGTTKIILDTYMAQVNHRMQLEKAVVEGDNKRANRGQIISAILSIFCIGAGGVLAYLGKNIVGLSLIIGSIGTLITAFYGGAILRKIERTQKWRG